LSLLSAADGLKSPSSCLGHGKSRYDHWKEAARGHWFCLTVVEDRKTSATAGIQTPIPQLPHYRSSHYVIGN